MANAYDSDTSIASTCYSNESTSRHRNDSIDSAFSQISVSEIDRAESTPVWNMKHARSKSDVSCSSANFECVKSSNLLSLPCSLSENSIPPQKSIFEGKQMVVPTECFFPRPEEGQSLTSFLSSNDFNISAELDRENAHFRISEALIAAIEHMKCAQRLKIVEEEEESDEEIRKLNQRIRIRRRERQQEKVMKNVVLLSDGKTDTTSQSASPPVSSHSSDFEVDSIGSEEEVEDLELSTATNTNLSSLKENGLSLSMASMYSDADICKLSQSADINNASVSAECVALSLLKKFSEKQLPKASDLQWLVSEQEAPQQLLPLPNSWPVSPDTIEEEFNLKKTRLRGNLEWAPPRPQIIFVLLPNLKRKDIIERQKYRCAGCGMKIEKGSFSKFRYCSYLGKYFCQCCHTNQLSVIPGRVMWRWDFTRSPVSRFAFQLLDQMAADPLFNVQDINMELYARARALHQCTHARTQLFYLKDFVHTCRKARSLQDLLKQQNGYLASEPHTYSLQDFIQVKSGELVQHVRNLVRICVSHVKECVICQAKGFICEICRKENDVIFSFQLEKVTQCQACGSRFHKTCARNVRCPKCLRIEQRKRRQQQEVEC